MNPATDPAMNPPSSVARRHIVPSWLLVPVLAAGLVVGLPAALSGCSLIDGLSGGDSSSEFDAGFPDCRFDPNAPGCFTFTCDDPLLLGTLQPFLETQINTCGMGSGSDFASCAANGFQAPDLVMTFETFDLSPYQVCVSGDSGGVVLASDFCEPGPAGNPFTCGPEDGCFDVFPGEAGLQFLTWESFGTGQCGELFITINSLMGPPPGADAGPG